jgi:anthranilate phosphoribosyltransferase
VIQSVLSRDSEMSTSIPVLLREISKNPPPSLPSESLLSTALTDVILGIATHAQCSALLTGLHFTQLDHHPAVISAFAKTMRKHALKVHRADLGRHVPKDAFLLDIVGTGGDGWGTFNASTSAAIVAAGAGCYICKAQPPADFFLFSRDWS